LKPYCLQIEIAGSIRRKKPDVKDIELVAVADKYKLEKYFIDNWIVDLGLRKRTRLYHKEWQHQFLLAHAS